MTRVIARMPLCAAILLIACGGAKVGTHTTATTRKDNVKPQTDEPAYSDVLEPRDASWDVEAETLDSAVSGVTVYSDRARVTRTGDASLGTEPAVFAFRKLPGWVDEESVRVAVTAGRIVDVRVERRFLAKATDESWKAAESEHKEISRKMDALRDELAVLDAQKAQVDSIKAFSVEKIEKDTVIGDVSVESYDSVLDFIGDALRRISANRRKAERQLEEIQPEFDASAKRLDDMKNLQQLEETVVFVTLQASGEVASTIELTYMIPGVTWEPMHELRASTSDQKRVEVASFAVVTQTSGEDWSGASIAFSTQSSVQAVRIPELTALTLGDTRTTSSMLTTKISSFSRAQQAFEGQNQLWNKVQRAYANRRESFDQSYQSNLEYLQVVQSKTVRMFESLQRRGTTAHFKALASVRVPGDGSPVRMRIGQSTLSSTQHIVAVPEQTLNAARTMEMTNSTGQPLLPGQVALYQDGAFLGVTEIDFIAKGERFSMFLSVADQVKLSRALDRKESSIVRKKRTRMKLSYVVTVENLSKGEVALDLLDRIPVSQNRDIKVDGVKISPPLKPDSKGLLRWKLSLAPGEKREFRIRYSVEYPPTLILETRQRRQYNEMSRPKKAMDKLMAPAEPYGGYEIEEQLLDLEEML